VSFQDREDRKRTLAKTSNNSCYRTTTGDSLSCSIYDLYSRQKKVNRQWVEQFHRSASQV